MSNQDSDAADGLCISRPKAKAATEQPVQKNPPSEINKTGYSDPKLEYKMDHANRGFCLVFNQVNFDDPRNKTRVGSDVDAAAVQASFERLGFEVCLYKDKKCSKIRKIVVDFQKKDHTHCDCLAVVIMSHGKQDVFYAKDEELKLDWVAEQFKYCPSLAGKPKLFFVQACRGTNPDDGQLLPEYIDGTDVKIDRPCLVRLPLEADFCYFYATPPGYVGWRNSTNGTWFIQQLTAVLDKHGSTLEWQHLMLLVQRFVALEYESQTNDPNTSKKKQMPVVVSQLRKLLYFHPRK